MECKPLRSFTFVSLTFLFGVCSVSPSSFSYPLTRTSLQSNDSIKITRSSRDASNAVTAQDGPLAPGTHNLAIGIGQIFLMGDLSKNYDNAIGYELNYTYGVSDLFDFEANFGYSSHSSSAFSMWHTGAGVRTNLVYFDQLVPFFTAGLGFFDPSYTLPAGATVSGLVFGMQLGAGVELLLSKQVFFGTRLTFNDAFSSTKKGSDGVNHDIGGSFVSFLLHIGYTF